MAAHSIRRIQQLPVPLEVAWDFFSSPSNLAAITPPSMDFRVTSTFESRKIYAGQIIEYRVRPLFGISLGWMTEITHVKDMEFFVDEQRSGPYKFWHHQHHFKSIDGGVEVTDIVHYKIPFGIMGKLVNRWLVASRLRNIFDFRQSVLEEKFGRMANG